MPIEGPALDAPAHLPRLLDRALSTKPDATALVSHGERLTWRELESASVRFAGHLLDMGLQPGDRIASLMPNRPALLVHYLACMKAGLVATPLNYRYQPTEMDHALSVSGASAILVHVEREADITQSGEVVKLSLPPIAYGGSPKGVTHTQ